MQSPHSCNLPVTAPWQYRKAQSEVTHLFRPCLSLLIGVHVLPICLSAPFAVDATVLWVSHLPGLLCFQLRLQSLGVMLIAK